MSYLTGMKHRSWPWLVPLLFIGFLGGCKERVNKAKTESTAAVSITEKPFITEPKTWLRNVDESEQIAFEVQQLTGGFLCKHLRRGQLSKLKEAYSNDFEIRAPASFRLVKSDENSSRTRVSHAQLSEKDETIVSGQKLEAWLQEALSNFTVIERCSIKPHQILVSEGKNQVWGKFDIMLGGQNNGSGASELHAQARAHLRLEARKWILTKLEINDLSQINYQGPIFKDVSALTGVDLFRSAEKQSTLAGATASIRETEYYGGVTVLDWNDDGFADFMVYEFESLLSVFINDGQGGFTRLTQDKLIPHKQASAFYIAIDLDNDGKLEIVGTRVEKCDQDGAKIPIYRIQRGALQQSEKYIRFRANCDARYVHVTGADVNLDGLPDLFFSGFDSQQENSQTEQYGGVPHNFVDAHDGARNRMLINRGDMNFEDRSDSVGLDSKTRKTYLGHFFDYDQDSHLDLLVVNDFAANQMFKGQGNGHFKQISYPPFTDSGFSMGVSVVDYDADGDFDVYVSNMYSYAGNRVLAVTDSLDQQKREVLLAMARGNTLYKRDGLSYREKAVDEGINNAQWAWGQQFFDYDNDGDLDLHVVNGLSSNPHEDSKKIPDF
ncbi:MAG: VCBS repeat-containing protein [Myxococcota bacterium]|nr:VCBS repeat-containing protein [Myxococcota bacterium]